MPRVIWKGSISFGLVEIPVGVYPGESRDEVGFTMLDKNDLAPVGYRRYNKKSGKEVAWQDIVKGYEYAPGEYVLMNDPDFKRANPRASQTIDIVNFVEREEIEPWFYEAPYYLEPAKKDSKGYALLRETLKRTKKVGIAKVVLRTREYLAAVFAAGDVLVLNTLRFAHEIRDPSELNVPGHDLEKLGVSPRELQMAEALVNGMSDEWAPEQYKDTYRNDLMAYIDRKVKSGETEAIEEPEGEEAQPRRRGEVVDLMPLLKQSLEHQGRRGGGEHETGRADARKSAPRRKTKTAAKSSAKRRKQA